VTETDCPGTSLWSNAVAVSFICPVSLLPVQLFPACAVIFVIDTDVKPVGIVIMAEPNLFPGGSESSLVIVIVYGCVSLVKADVGCIVAVNRGLLSVNVVMARTLSPHSTSTV
jgi:hypothetical protein